ncbi:hypothetical protein COCNU_scaffold022529G000010 [Cocos nucifera]|nr:hypothetical protein [Cocos nucifera]
MDAEAVEMLSKGLYAQKGKAKALGKSSKKARVEVPNSTTPIAAVVAFEIAEGAEVVLATKVGTVNGGSLPPTSSSPFVGDQAPKPTIDREKGEEKKKRKRSTIVKMFHRARPSESNDDNDNLGEDLDPFNNPEII